MKFNWLYFLITFVVVVFCLDGFFWQLPFFGCETPMPDPYGDDYDCLRNDVYFVNSELVKTSLMAGLYVSLKTIKHQLERIIGILLALSIGGLMDILANTPNSNLSILALIAALIYIAIIHGKTR